MLVLSPAHLTRSRSFVEYNETNEINNMIKIRIDKLQKSINKEKYLFYTNLLDKHGDKISEEDSQHNIEFITRIGDNALYAKSLPSISVSQAILETGFGRSTKLEHNIFGIKGRGIKSKTKEFYNNRFIEITAEFQRFNSLTEAFDRHYDIIGKYVGDNREYKDWAFKIKKNGYATDPRYAYKLIYLIEKYELHRLDRIQEMKNEMEDLLENQYAGL